jgi:hypothetical protein
MLKVFIEKKPQYITDHYIYVIDENEYYYSINEEGFIVKTAYDSDPTKANETKPFLKLTGSIFDALTSALIDHAKDNNRLDNVAKLQGKEERYKDEVGFLRELIKTQLK